MTLILPTSAGSPISQWVVLDWTTPATTSQPAADGFATVAFPQLDTETQWLLDHAVAQCDSTTDTVMRLYDSDPNRGTLWDGTDAGNFNVADWSPGLLIRPQGQLLAVWSGCSDGAVATLRVQARVMRRVAS